MAMHVFQPAHPLHCFLSPRQRSPLLPFPLSLHVNASLRELTENRAFCFLGMSLNLLPLDRGCFPKGKSQLQRQLLRTGQMGCVASLGLEAKGCVPMHPASSPKPFVLPTSPSVLCAFLIPSYPSEAPGKGRWHEPLNLEGIRHHQQSFPYKAEQNEYRKHLTSYIAFWSLSNV